MPVKFEWQAEQEQEWTEEQDVVPGGNTAVSLRTHWRIWLALQGLIIIIGGVTYVLLNRQADKVSNLISDDVLASHRLVTQTVASRDVDVFATMLFPYSRDWSETQLQLLNQQLFMDRVPLGLRASPYLVETEPEVTLAPDLQTAVITTHMPYIIEVGETVTETVVLAHTAVYQRDESQWLLAPPPDDDSFWGDDITEKGNVLTLIYPTRDAEIGRRLIVDLDKALEDLCWLEGISCLPSFKLRLKLATDFGQLLALGDSYRTVNPRRISGGAMSLTLPAPTLVGRPLDEAGYQALLRGYAGWVTAVLVNEFNRAQQPDQAAITRQLAQIDLRPPPLNRERPWQHQPPPPIPWPEQDILVMCRVNDLRAEVWRYELAESNWVDETAVFSEADPSLLATPNRLLLLPMPDDDGAAALSFDFSDLGDGPIYLWRDGVVTPLIEAAPAHSWLPTTYILPGSVGDRFLIFHQRDGELTENDSFEWLDLAQCPGPACQLQSTGGVLPLWSPDEQKTVLIQTSMAGTPRLSLGDANGVETAVVGVGWSPVWVDDTEFAYLRPDSSLESVKFMDDLTSTELALAEWTNVAALPTPRTLLTSDDLRAALPENGRPAHLLMAAAATAPSRPDQWFIQATTSLNTPTGQDFVFAYDRESREVSLNLALANRSQGRVQVAGNGRFLTMTSLENDGPVYLIHDLESSQTTTYSFTLSYFISADWSADGRWLVIADEDAIWLIAPGSRYERPIVHGLDGCVTAVWVNR